MIFGPPWERKYTGVRGMTDRLECTCLRAMDEVLFSGDADARCVIVLAQRSRGVERGYREIARMRQMIDVSIPMREFCIGDGGTCPDGSFICLTFCAVV